MSYARYVLNEDTNNTGIDTSDNWTKPATFDTGCIYQYAMTDGEMVWDANTTSEILNNNGFTWAGWVYVDPNVSSETAPLFGNDNLGANNNRKFFISQGPTKNDVSWFWMNDEATTAFIRGTLPGVLKDFEWTHIAITYGSQTFRIYVNGVNEYTQSGVHSKSSSFMYDTQVFHSNPARRLQDVRIYSEAIDDTEIKKLVYGLQIHNKLNKKVDGSENKVSTTGDTPRYDKCLILTKPLTLGDYPINKSNSIAISFWYKLDTSNIVNLLTCAKADAYTKVTKLIHKATGGLTIESPINEPSVDGESYKTGTKRTDNGMTEYVYTPYACQGIFLKYVDGILKVKVDDSPLSDVSNVLDNNWHHIVINSDGFRNVDVYFDNELKVSKLKPKSGNNVLRAESNELIRLSDGISVSDFRLYGRHLTEAECLRLYGIAHEDYDSTN